MEILDVQRQRDEWFSRRKRLIWRATRRFRELDPINRVHVDDYPYPHYAYGVLVSCMQARMLGHSAVTVIEFGVAGGNGLVALEASAGEIGDALGVQVHVQGFDHGEGMPAADNIRDVLYWYRPGAYKMDVHLLQQRLTRARLSIGLIEETIAAAAKDLRGPIGFCAFDMDYYSATTNALRIFDLPQSTRLPRVLVYADDIFGWHDLTLMCSDVGEECAFNEFNVAHQELKIQKVRGLRYKRPIPASWNDKMFALHDFGHPNYSTPINPESEASAAALLKLR